MSDDKIPYVVGCIDCGEYLQLGNVSKGFKKKLDKFTRHHLEECDYRGLVLALSEDDLNFNMADNTWVEQL